MKNILLLCLISWFFVVVVLAPSSDRRKSPKCIGSKCGSPVPFRGFMIVLTCGSKKNGIEYRSFPERFITRWGVDLSKPLDNRLSMSPTFHTNVPSILGTSIQSPWGVWTCRPPIPSCARSVSAPKSVCGAEPYKSSGLSIGLGG